MSTFVRARPLLVDLGPPARKRPPRKRVKNSNTNENKQRISPSIAEKAVCTANFAPFLDFFGKSFSISASSQVPWVQHGFALTSALPPQEAAGSSPATPADFLLVNFVRRALYRLSNPRYLSISE